MHVVLVTGAGGFIGGHLVKRLKAEGHYVVAADIKAPRWGDSPADKAYWDRDGDCRDLPTARRLVDGVDDVYHLAADMGGIGYISGNRATICRNNTRINLSMLEAAADAKIARFLYSSSACVYNQQHQADAAVTPLKEADAWPALPEEGYGLEKLYMEKLCEYFQSDLQLSTRVVRFHNVYGPEGEFDGGREKAPAAACRKVAMATNGQIEIWGDGEQTRSFMYIDDCVEGLLRLMASDYSAPLNLGSDELVTINQLFDMVMDIAQKPLTKVHLLDKPQGVRGRNSDNSKLREVLGWEPATRLIDGLRPTYQWIKENV